MTNTVWQEELAFRAALMMRLDGLFNSQNTQLALINERLDKIETVAMENRKELQELKVDVTTMALNITHLDQQIQSLEELLKDSTTLSTIQI